MTATAIFISPCNISLNALTNYLRNITFQSNTVCLTTRVSEIAESQTYLSHLNLFECQMFTFSPRE